MVKNQRDQGACPKAATHPAKNAKLRLKYNFCFN